MPWAPWGSKGEYRRLTPAYYRACLNNGGLSAAVLRCRNFVRQCSRVNPADSPLKTELHDRAPRRFKGPKFWRFAREGLFRYTPTGLLRDVRGDYRDSCDLAEWYCNLTYVLRAPPHHFFPQRPATPLTRRAFCGCTNAHFDAFPSSRPSMEV